MRYFGFHQSGMRHTISLDRTDTIGWHYDNPMGIRDGNYGLGTEMVSKCFLRNWKCFVKKFMPTQYDYD